MVTAATFFFIWTLGMMPGTVGIPVTIGGFGTAQDCEAYRAAFLVRVQATPYGWSTTVCQAKP